MAKGYLFNQQTAQRIVNATRAAERSGIVPPPTTTGLLGKELQGFWAIVSDAPTDNSYPFTTAYESGGDWTAYDEGDGEYLTGDCMNLAENASGDGWLATDTPIWVWYVYQDDDTVNYYTITPIQLPPLPDYDAFLHFNSSSGVLEWGHTATC
ncbi:MAG: hypothetical protein BIFFINMI_03565 [Phycisphaerae bacterium]|nr:hypothetical protein [Phycisphaerae bacterium]